MTAAVEWAAVIAASERAVEVVAVALVAMLVVVVVVCVVVEVVVATADGRLMVVLMSQLAVLQTAFLVV